MASPPFKLISAESPLVETPDLWLKRIHRSYLDRAPRMIREGGRDCLKFEGGSLRAEEVALGMRLRPDGRRWENIYPGAWDPTARVKDMDQAGVEVEVVRPSLGLFTLSLRDPAYRRASIQAVNEWVADFCAVYPTRFARTALLPSEPPDMTVAEMRRMAQRGGAPMAAGMVLLEIREGEQRPFMGYDPIWAAAEELHLPLRLHLPQKGPSTGADPTMDRSLEFFPAMRALALMVSSGLFERHPRLRMVIADGGWAAALMERMDHEYQTLGGGYGGAMPPRRLPSQQCRAQIYFTVTNDHTLIRNREYLGIENIMWSAPLQLSDAWPAPEAVLGTCLHGVPLDQQQKIGRTNAANLYRLPIKG